MPTRDEQIARLRVACITGRLPADLGAWIYEQLESATAAKRARELRRAAAATEASSKKKRALELASIIAMFGEYPALVSVAWYPPGSACAIVQSLMRAGPLPRSPRHLMRLIA